MELLDRGEGGGDQGAGLELAWVLARSGNGKIRCPGCGWVPSKDSLWSCVPECGTSWNTFNTRGKCPGCEKQWTYTACLRCSGWFPHDDWYVKGT